ncbi:MAG TPA: hypothetical protein VND64_15175 [Pirellulales bacterium]|nr:hypothetical protein [Pirellulales bacterium]
MRLPEEAAVGAEEEEGRVGAVVERLVAEAAHDQRPRPRRGHPRVARPQDRAAQRPIAALR